MLLSALGTSANKLQVFGNDYATPDGSCVRDYVHVDDIASAHLLALDYLNRGGLSEIMNLGNGEGFSVFQVIECAHRVTGKTISYELAQRRPGDPPTLVAAALRAKKLLKWIPKYTSLESIVETAWRWHSSRST